jgi:hypothetical protein
MGLNFFTAREILDGRRGGQLGDVVTIGRLQQFMLRGQLDALRTRFGLPGGPWLTHPYGAWADDFFAAAGARSLTAIDISAYEHAGIVHDMNEPIAPELHCRYDLCIDGGSLEHVFRPDQALANAMRLTAVGGRLIVWTPANNLCGHGFFQFSPEFFFSALRAPSGFALAHVLLVECVYPAVSLVPPRRAFRVRDPRELGERIGVQSRYPLMLLVSATKLHHLAEPFAVAPRQSDYETQWRSDGGRRPAARRSLVGAAARSVRRNRATSLVVNHALGLAQRRRYSLRNRRFFGPET